MRITKSPEELKTKPAYALWRFQRHALRSSDYWYRRWTIQELVLARDAEFLYGRHRIDMNSFLLEASEGPGSHRVDDPLDRWRQLRCMSKRRRSLRAVLRLSEHCECDDPRDNIFAILSILRNTDREILSHFFPDYSLSLQRVQLIAFAFLRQEQYSRKRSNRANVKEAFRLLQISSKSFQTELLSKSVVSASIKSTRPLALPAIAFALQPLARRPSLGSYNECKQARDQARQVWIDLRVEALRVIASMPLDAEPRRLTEC